MSDPSLEILQSVNYVIQAFDKYTLTSDKSLITGFSREQLERTINLYSGDQAARGRGWYQAISRRLDEMGREEQNRRQTGTNGRTDLSEQQSHLSFGQSLSLSEGHGDECRCRLEGEMKTGWFRFLILVVMVVLIPAL